MHVQMVDTVEALVALRPEWNDLARRSARATTFQRPEWLLAWADLFLEGHLRTVAVRDCERLVALAPLYIWRTAEGTRELRFLGSGNTDYQDALVDSSVRESALATIADAIARLEDWDLARFEQMHDGAEFLDLPLPP